MNKRKSHVIAGTASICQHSADTVIPATNIKERPSL
jgi:hypothetical protein